MTQHLLCAGNSLLFIFILSSWQAMSSRAVAHPSRPQIRISSTFFWHLSSDYDLEPIPMLAKQATFRGGASQNQLDDGIKLPVYGRMKVGRQVEKYVTFMIVCSVVYLSDLHGLPFSELRHIALMT